MLHIIWDLLLHRRGRRARTLRVEECICRVVAHLTQERKHLREVLIRLPRKTDNEIGRQACVWQCLTHALCTLAVLLHRVDAVHRLENAVAAVLHGKMDVLTDMLPVLDRINQLVTDVLRMRGHKAHAANALHLVHHAHEIGKIRLFVVFAVRVHILSEQRHLGIALRDRTAHLRHDLLRRTAALTSAHIGYDAVGTVVVAAIHDGHPRRELAAACNGQILRNRLVCERHVHHRRMLCLDLRNNA